MCHSLAFSFARATRSVSLTPPAYYADLGQSTPLSFELMHADYVSSCSYFAACGKARVLIARDMDNNPLIDGAEYPPLRFQQEVVSLWYLPFNPTDARTDLFLDLSTRPSWHRSNVASIRRTRTVLCTPTPTCVHCSLCSPFDLELRS